MKRNLGFRAWFYFRQGWATYFAFLFAAINTLTVTFYLAIEKYPLLSNIFPTFLHYVIILSGIAIPLLIVVGYAHYKRTPSYLAETAVQMETDPFRRRIMVNGEISVLLNFKLIEIILNIYKNEKLSQEQLDEIIKIHDSLSKLVKERTFANKKDLEFYKNSANFQ